MHVQIQTAERKSSMFSIEEVRKSNRTGLLISSFVAHFTAMALVLMMVLGPSTVSARRLPTPQNFRVTATTAYTVTVAWDPPGHNSGNFNYHLSGAYGVEPAVLPQTATSYVNGSFEDIRFGSGGPIIAYGEFGDNTIEVIASDTAGNASLPATTTLFIP